MLNSNSLAQLQALKSQIKTDHEASLKTGTVRGSQGRFGFVGTEDGQSFFLTPDEMAKVFPGDEIQFSTKEDDKGKTQAVIEKLIRSDLKGFCGQFVKRGKAQFVAPDLNGLNNWLYIPPDACKDVEDNEWLVCEVTRHPYPSGKPQAKVVKRLGQLSDAGFERQYAIEKFELNYEWPETTPSELALLAEDSIPAMSEGREDLTELPFVTIDSEHTRDMDDALFAQATESGWLLQIAIADPSAWFGMNTALDKEAARRGNSLYFPGRSLPMLPQELSNGLCSLLENKNRLALICKIHLDANGAVSNTEFSEALVKSHGKLSYNQVSDFIGGNQDAVDNGLAEHLTTLHQATQALADYRQKNNLVMDDRPDYYLNIGDNGKIQTILKADRNQAQKLVEEAMLAANICCANFLKEIGTGIFIEHAGFRTERIGDVKTIIEQQGIQFDGDFTQAEGYKNLIKSLDTVESERPLKTLLSRFLIRSEFTQTAQAHQGMGFEAYTTFTSPIRKYNDLLVHRIIKAHLNKGKLPEITEKTIENLQDLLIKGRNAVSMAENWLKLQFLEKSEQKEFNGIIQQVNPAGLMVQIVEIGIDGFVDLRKQKFEFDKVYLSHKKGDVQYQLDQEVKIKIKDVDLQQRKLEIELA
jgi:VacB/RNase II family 3'-5' exoribonuclease